MNAVKCPTAFAGPRKLNSEDRRTLLPLLIRMLMRQTIRPTPGPSRVPIERVVVRTRDFVRYLSLPPEEALIMSILTALDPLPVLRIAQLLGNRAKLLFYLMLPCSVAPMSVVLMRLVSRVAFVSCMRL